MNRADYPADWKRISAAIRARSGGQCECTGECELHRDHPGPRRCQERQGQPARWAKGKVVLTVAHLDHNPANCAADNLKAMCQRCHLRIDREQHQANARLTRLRKRGRPLLDALGEETGR